MLRPNDPGSVKVLQEHKLARASAWGGSLVGAAGLAAAGIDHAAGQCANARFASSPTDHAGRWEFTTGSGKGTRKGVSSR